SRAPACPAGPLPLPLIGGLLPATPPSPQRIAFPPTRILMGLENREKTPAQTPWWLTLIRMAAAGLVILALAEPVLNPNRETALSGSGPLVLVVDNGWAAAAQWGARAFMLEQLIAEAEGRNRPLPTAPPPRPAHGHRGSRSSRPPPRARPPPPSRSSPSRPTGRPRLRPSRPRWRGAQWRASCGSPTASITMVARAPSPSGSPSSRVG